MKYILIFLLTSTTTFAQDFSFDKESGQAIPNYIGQIKNFRGEVYKNKGGSLIAVKAGTRFYKSDSVITKDKSFVQINFVDDTVINLSENSEVNFAEFDFQDKNNRKAIFSFIKGQLRALVKNKAKPGDFLFKTKMATMAIRGTELLVNFQKLANKEIAEFGLVEGTAIVNDEKNNKFEIKQSDRIVIVRDVDNGVEASEPRPLTHEEIRHLNSKESFLPYLIPSEVTKQSPLYVVLNLESPTQISSPESHGVEQKNPQQKNWKQNLDKLNEKLKEYQKK